MRRRILGRYGEQFKEKEQYHTVVFVDPIDHVISTQQVKHGEAAIPPEPLEHEFLVFDHWTHGTSNVTYDMVVGAIYDTVGSQTALWFHNPTGVVQPIILAANGQAAPLDFTVYDADRNVFYTLTKSIAGAPTYFDLYLPIGDSVITIETTTGGNYAMGHTPSNLGPVATMPLACTCYRIYNGKKWRGLSSLFFGENPDTIEAVVLDSAPAVTLINAVTNFTKLKNMIVDDMYSLQQNCFNNCPALEYIPMSPAVGQSNLAFINCPKLKQLNLPRFITILDNFIQGCTSLETVVVESTTTKFNGLFGTNIPNMKKLILLRETNPTTATAGAFVNLPQECNIYVPDSLVDAYKTLPGYNTISDQIKPMSQLNLK